MVRHGKFTLAAVAASGVLSFAPLNAVAQEPPVAPPPPPPARPVSPDERLKHHIEEMENRARELREQGKAEEAEAIAQRIRAVMERAKQAGGERDAPRGERGDLDARARHFLEAAEHLRAAGANDLADMALKQAREAKQAEGIRIQLQLEPQPGRPAQATATGRIVLSTAPPAGVVTAVPVPAPHHPQPAGDQKKMLFFSQAGAGGPHVVQIPPQGGHGAGGAAVHWIGQPEHPRPQPRHDFVIPAPQPHALPGSSHWSAPIQQHQQQRRMMIIRQHGPHGPQRPHAPMPMPAPGMSPGAGGQFQLFTHPVPGPQGGFAPGRQLPHPPQRGPQSIEQLAQQVQQLSEQLEHLKQMLHPMHGR